MLLDGEASEIFNVGAVIGSSSGFTNSAECGHVDVGLGGELDRQHEDEQYERYERKKSVRYSWEAQFQAHSESSLCFHADFLSSLLLFSPFLSCLLAVSHFPFIYCSSPKMSMSRHVSYACRDAFRFVSSIVYVLLNCVFIHPWALLNP